MGEHRYYALELGRLTVGYDLSSNRTLVRSWSLAVTGPDDLSASGLAKEASRRLEEDLRASAEQAGFEAGTAAYAVPGEFGAKLAVAWEVFWQRFPVLVQARQRDRANQFLQSFSIGLLEDTIELDGLVLEATAGKATAQMYEKVYSLIGKNVGGDLGKAVNTYLGLLNRFNDLTTVDIHVQVPREVTHVIAEAVDAAEKLAEIGKALEDAPQRLVDFEVKVRDQIAATGKEVTEKISAIAVEVGNIGNRLAEQLRNANLHVDFPDVSNLLPGVPRLDLKAAGTALEQALKDGAIKIYRDLGNAVNNEIDIALVGLRAVGDALKNAIANCERDLVAELQSDFDEASKAYDDAKDRLDRMVDALKGANVGAVADQLVQDAAKFVAEFIVLQKVSADAIVDVERNIAAAAEEAARQILQAAQDALDAARNALNRTFGISL